MSQVLIAEALEMLKIHRVLLHDAQMINESYPRLVADINRDIATLHAKVNTLTRRFDSSEQDVMRYTAKVKEDEEHLRMLQTSPTSFRTKQHESTAQVVARLKREIEKLEGAMLKEERADSA